MNRWASHGIKDRVAIVGMGCTRFGEHWDKGLDDLIIEAAREAFASAGVTKDDVDAYWFGTAQSAMSGISARPAAPARPASRSPGSRTTAPPAPRRCAQAAYAVASGAYDMAMARRRGEGQGRRLPGPQRVPDPRRRHGAYLTAAAMFSMVAPAYANKYGVAEDDLRDVLARIAAKNHCNGARNPRAQFRQEVTKETIVPSPRVAGELSGVRLRRRRRRRRRGDRRPGRGRAPLHRQAALHQGAVVRRRQRLGPRRPRYDYTHFPECAAAAATPTPRPGSPTPGDELAMAEVHDCFTPTELVLMEDLGFAERGTAWKEVLAGDVRPRRRACRSTPTAG